MIVYKVTQKSKNNKVVYIGQTVSTLKERMSEHRYSVKRSNNHFANALGKYGFDDFEFSVLDEATSLTQLNEKEARWVEEIKPEYNMTPGGDAKRRFSKKIKHLQTGEIYESVAEAAEKLGLSRISVSQAVNGKATHAGGQTFSYDLSAEHEEEIERKWVKRSVKHLQTGDIYASCCKAAKSLGISSESVAKVANGECRQVKGHTFSYDLTKEAEPSVKKPARKNYGPSPFKKPFKHLQTGKVYSSLAEAEKDLELFSGDISAVLNGKLRHTKGNTFSYNKDAQLEPKAKRKNARS